MNNIHLLLSRIHWLFKFLILSTRQTWPHMDFFAIYTGYPFAVKMQFIIQFKTLLIFFLNHPFITSSTCNKQCVNVTWLPTSTSITVQFPEINCCSPAPPTTPNDSFLRLDCNARDDYFTWNDYQRWNLKYKECAYAIIIAHVAT